MISWCIHMITWLYSCICIYTCISAHHLCANLACSSGCTRWRTKSFGEVMNLILWGWNIWKVAGGGTFFWAQKVGQGFECWLMIWKCSCYLGIQLSHWATKKFYALGLEQLKVEDASHPSPHSSSPKWLSPPQGLAASGKAQFPPNWEKPISDHRGGSGVGWVLRLWSRNGCLDLGFLLTRWELSAFTFWRFQWTPRTAATCSIRGRLGFGRFRGVHERAVKAC